MTKPKILIVDDEPLILSSLRRTFQKDYTVSTASSGAEALEKLAEEGSVDGVISDWDMPGMHGSELVRQIKTNEAYAEIPIITMSGAYNNEREKVVEYHENRWVREFLDKPCDISHLRSCIQRYFEKPKE